MHTSTSSTERIILEAKQAACEAYAKRAGTKYLTALQKGFYRRMAELDELTS